MNFVAKEFLCQRSSLGSVQMKMSIYVLQNCRLQTAIPLGEFFSVKETVCFCFLRTHSHTTNFQLSLIAKLFSKKIQNSKKFRTSRLRATQGAVITAYHNFEPSIIF